MSDTATNNKAKEIEIYESSDSAVVGHAVGPGEEYTVVKVTL